jgi:transglutaminase-like putative cysteine protease
LKNESRDVQGWITGLLLVGMTLASATTMVATDWTDQLDRVPLAGLVALVVGLLLSVSTFGAWFSHLVSAVYGIAWVGFLIGRGLPGDLTWHERISQLGIRITSWVQQAASGGTSQDSLIFVLFLSLLFWILGYSAAWNTYRRKRPWFAAVPLAVTSIVATHFYVGDAPLARYLLFYLLLALLYIGRVQTSKEERSWRHARVAYDPKLGIDVMRSSLILALVVLTVAWTLPSSSSAATSVSEIWERVNTPWESLEEEWQRLFSSVHSGEVEVDEPFGTSLSLGGPSGLADTLALDIEAPRVGRYYWRATVYASYDGREWHLPRGQTVSVVPGAEALSARAYASRRVTQQTVTNYLTGRRLLVGASQPATIHREAQALAHVMDGSPWAFHRISSPAPLGAGDTYTLTSYVSGADATSLRQAGAEYPDWVREAYLQLPSGLPERVGTLAERITSGAETPYDKARLLEQYLRDTITYDLSPPPLPPQRDYVDFLLFESQRGYCNGYASALVVMARTLDVPARLASGYAEGTYDEERGVFRVRQNNAHSWPELYFPGYGWVEFEPTVSEDPLVRPERDMGTDTAEPVPTPMNDDLAGDLARRDDELPQMLEEIDDPFSAEPTSPTPTVWPWVAGGLSLLAFVFAGSWALENVGIRRLPAAEQAYARLLRFGGWLGRPLKGADTPLEWVRELANLVPEAEEPISRIGALYVRAQFGRGDPQDPAAQLSWTRARGLLWRHLLWDRWRHRLRPNVRSVEGAS